VVTRRRAAPRGFTLVEVLVALGIMAVGMVGVLALQKGAANASGYSRRATEAAILAEDKLEQLRTVPMVGVTDGADRVDAGGVPADDAVFVRSWTVVWADTLATLTVTVGWNESDGAHSITYRTVRTR
jgi:type IV pilus assembly protein PilV